MPLVMPFSTAHINHPEKVKPATRDKIEKIIRELGYKPNLNAKGLASSKSTTVAVVVPELTRSSIAEIVNGIADCATKRGYLVRLFVAGRNNYENAEEQLEAEKELWATVVSSSVDGVLYINDEFTEEHEKLLEDVPMPVVLTNTPCSNPNIPEVSIDYYQAAYGVTKEMINRGNRKIWMIKTIRNYAMNNLKVDGYLAAMKEANLEPRIIEVSGLTERNEKSFEELLKNEHPDVAIVVRDSMAVSFINVARLLHIHIPEDLQVIGFQNTRYAELARPKLTSVNTPIYEIGEVAMDLLTELMYEDELEEDWYIDEEVEKEKEEIEINKNVDYSVVWRQSTK